MVLRGVIFDVDGTLLRGDEPIDGARAGLETVRNAGLRPLFVSNNPAKPPDAYERRFRQAGLEVQSSDVLTAGVATTDYLTTHHPDATIAVVGEPGLVELLREADLDVDRIHTNTEMTGAQDRSHAETGDRTESGIADSAASLSPDVLVASVDRAFDYTLLRTCLHILADPTVTFVGTDPDVVIPTADGAAPGSGAIINAIANVADREPDAVLGKPTDTIRKLALERLGLPPEEILVVGDRLDTDIALGHRDGMTTALVGTGVTDDVDLRTSSIQPDYVLDSLADLDGLLERLNPSGNSY